MASQHFTLFLFSVLTLSMISIPSNNTLISDAFGDHPEVNNSSGDDNDPNFIVQMNSDHSMATGTGVFQFNEDNTEVNYQIVLSGLDLDGNQTLNAIPHTPEFTSAFISTNSDTSVEDGHDEKFVNDGGDGTSDGPDLDDVIKIEIQNRPLGEIGASIITIFDDSLIDDGHDTMSECTLNSLEDLAQEFLNNRAYINFHTDDGIHPQNTGPGDLATPGEIRGNIGPAGTNTYAATINVSQQILDDVDDPTLWDSVTATGTVVFLTGHHSDHIDFEITMNDLHNVSGVHIHLGNTTANSHIHAADLLTSTTSLLGGINSGPISNMDGTFSGIIEVDDLCPGADDHGGVHQTDNLNSGMVSTSSNTSVDDTHIPELNSGIISTSSNTSIKDDNIIIPEFTSAFISTNSDTSVDDGHDTMSECTLNSLEDLAQEFLNNRAYINFHTDDGIHPQNTGPGDLATPGEIRGNIGPAGTNTYAATINVSQQILDDVDDPTLWDSVTATGTVVFLTGHHSDHIDFEITMNDLHNVSGVHIHLGNTTANSHIHAADLLTSTTSLLGGINSGPISNMDGTFSGIIEVDDLCPGADDHGGDDEHDEGGPGNIDDDVIFNASTGTITGILDESDTIPLSIYTNNLCSEDLYLKVYTNGYPNGAIGGQILVHNSNEVCAALHSASNSSSGGISGGGGGRSTLMAPNLILYNSCSDNLDGIMRIITFNQPGLDLSAKISFKEFSNWAVNVSDEISYLKYIDLPNEHYQYSVFDVRFPTDLTSFWVGLYDNNDSSKFIHHLVEIPTDSCIGYEEPFDLKDRNASIIKPIEPLEIPQPEETLPSQIELKLLNEEKIAKVTFNLITEFNPVIHKFEDPNSLPTHSIFFNGTWDDLRQCYKEGGSNNRESCAFADNLHEQVELAKIKFFEITKYTPVIQSFEDPNSLTYHSIFFKGDWDDLRQCYKDGDSNHRENCAFADKILEQIELAQIKFIEITHGKPVINNFESQPVYPNTINGNNTRIGEI
ncbi:MAG: hypothetical protein ACE5DL_02155 [Nitrosopumilaceae archaeon]